MAKARRLDEVESLYRLKNDDNLSRGEKQALKEATLSERRRLIITTKGHVVDCVVEHFPWLCEEGEVRRVVAQADAVYCDVKCVVCDAVVLVARISTFHCTPMVPPWLTAAQTGRRMGTAAQVQTRLTQICNVGCARASCMRRDTLF